MTQTFEIRAASIATRLVQRAIQTGDLMWLTKHGTTFRTHTRKDAEQEVEKGRINMRSVVGVYNSFVDPEWIIEDMTYVMKGEK